MPSKINKIMSSLMSGLDDSHKVVNRSSQFEVRKKEKLYSGEQFANPRKHNLR